MFVYSGQGLALGRGMAPQAPRHDEPVFARSITSPSVFVDRSATRWDILSRQPGDQRRRPVQPVLMGLQLGLTDLWRSYGVHPDAVIGHSMGEVTAAVVSGALSVADGLKVIGVRSRLMSRMAGGGAPVARC